MGFHRNQFVGFIFCCFWFFLLFTSIPLRCFVGFQRVKILGLFHPTLIFTCCVIPSWILCLSFGVFVLYPDSYLYDVISGIVLLDVFPSVFGIVYFSTILPRVVFGGSRGLRSCFF